MGGLFELAKLDSLLVKLILHSLNPRSQVGIPILQFLKYFTRILFECEFVCAGSVCEARLGPPSIESFQFLNVHEALAKLAE